MDTNKDKQVVIVYRWYRYYKGEFTRAFIDNNLIDGDFYSMEEAHLAMHMYGWGNINEMFTLMSCPIKDWRVTNE